MDNPQKLTKTGYTRNRTKTNKTAIKPNTNNVNKTWALIQTTNGTVCINSSIMYGHQPSRYLEIQRGFVLPTLNETLKIPTHTLHNYMKLPPAQEYAYRK